MIVIIDFSLETFRHLLLSSREFVSGNSFNDRSLDRLLTKNKKRVKFCKLKKLLQYANFESKKKNYAISIGNFQFKHLKHRDEKKNPKAIKEANFVEMQFYRKSK